MNTMSNNVHIDNVLENLKISDAAKSLGVSTKTLRRWEAKGILNSRRSPSGHRVYSMSDLQNVGANPPVKKSYIFQLALAVLILAISVIRSSSGVSFGSPEVDHTEPAVLATSTEDATIPSISDFTFAVNVPAKFSEGVVFNKDITAPNIVTSVNGDAGDVTVDFELTAGNGITVDGLKVTNSGIISLTAGSGITVSGSTITNSGITSLTAGTGISVSGSTITNTLTPNYTLSGWTDNGTSITLTTTTDSVTVGSLTTGAIVADSLTTSGLALAGGLTVTSGNSLLPDTDLGSDIGSAAKRFNNLWVANINSNSSQAFSGQTTFSYAPTDTTVSQASVYINPTTAAANGQLLGLGIGGYQRALIDEDGDIILGYSDATSAPASDYPLNIYGHSGTRVAHIDTSGNGYFAGNVGIGTTTPGFKLEIAGTSSVADRTIAINTVPVVYLPDQVNMTGTLILGNGGRSMSHVSGVDGFNNTASGIDAGKSFTTAYSNNAFGYQALYSNTTGQLNDAFGTGALYTNISGVRNVAIGYHTLYNSTNGYNTGIGFNALGNISQGINNTAIGYETGMGITTGSYNTIIGSLVQGLSSSLANNIIIADGQGNQRIRVDSSGNVGIGTTAPGYQLEVKAISGTSALGLRQANDSSYLWRFFNDTYSTTLPAISSYINNTGNFYMGTQSGKSLGFTVGGDTSTKLLIDGATGNVGIGTTAPTSLLDLGATSGVDALRLTASGAKVLGLSYGTNNIAMTTASTDPTNKLSNGTFDTNLTSWSEVPSYALNDQFTTDRAAGAVNTTSAEPTGGARTVVDTTSKMSISSGALTVSGKNTVGDPRITYPIQTRIAGKTLVQTYTPTNTAGDVEIGFSTTTTGEMNNALRFYGDTSINSMANTTSSLAVGTFSGTQYQIASIMRSAGMYQFIKGGTYTNWTLLGIYAGGSSDLYPAIAAISQSPVFTADNIRIPTTTWLPTPLAYDTFTRADGAISSSETTGPDSQTTSALAWTGGAISTNKNVITPSLGSELVTNGDMETGNPPSNWLYTGYNVTTAPDADAYAGSNAMKVTLTSGYGYSAQAITVNSNTFYQASAYGKAIIGSYSLRLMDPNNGYALLGNAPTPFRSQTDVYTQEISTGRPYGNSLTWRLGSSANSGDNFLADNVSLKPLTLSSLFSSVSTSDADVIADADVTLTAGTQAGLVLNLDSTSSPANFIIVYHDGSYVKVDEAVAGVYTNKQSTAVTYSAGATLRAIREGTKLRVYYNNVLVGAELTMTANTNTKHGLFSTYSGNSFDNFVLWPRGSGTTKFTDAPFEELTATRNTTTKYNNSTASVQLVAGGTDANYLQSANVGDTQTYNLIAYAYTDGSAVSATDLSLYYDTSTLTTTYAPMGGTGWYKLTGTLTGVASSKDYGVRVKAGKTVYVDEMHLQVGTGTTQTMYVLNTGTGVTGINVQGIVNGTLNGIATLTKAGTVSDSDFTDTAVNGLMGIDTTNHRLYFREGGTWSYIARTGGFQIPADEVGDLQVGDNLMPYVESRMEDGALHGLYKKYDGTSLPSLTVAGNTTLGDAIITGSLLANDINSTLTLKLQSLDLAGIEFVGGKIKFTKEGLIYGNDLIRGKAMITTGATEIRVDKVWLESPISVIVTPEYDTNSWVTEITNTGFKINVSSSPTATESAINWQAIW